MKTLRWIQGVVVAIFSVVGQAQTLDIDALKQRMLDACPLQWEDVKAGIDPGLITGDVWQGDTVDRDTFIQFVQITLGEDAPDTTGLNAMTDDASTVAAQCATERIGFLDGLLAKLPTDVLAALAAVSEQLEHVGGDRLPSNCNVGEIVAYDGEKWRCSVATGGVALVPEEGELLADCQAWLAGGATDDSTYMIDPDGEGGVDPFQVFCDMTTDGGGWIKLSPNDPSGDNIWAAANDSQTSQLAYCENLGETLKYYRNVDSSSFSAQDIDYGFGVNESTVFNIDYTNPATGGNFTTAQVDSIRTKITTLSTSNKMVSMTCDDDNRNPAHELYLYDGVAGAGVEYDATPGTGSNGDIIWWVHHTDDSESLVDDGSPDPGPLPVSHILPKSLKIGHFSNNYERGSVTWGYEEGYILVK